MVKRLLSVLVFTLALFVLLFGARFSQIAYAKEHHYVPPPPTVAATRVVAAEWQPHLVAVGSLVAQRGVMVSNEIPGKVSAIHFDSGANANAGELLIELDTTTDAAELKRLQAGQRLAKIQLDRATRLATKAFASKSNVDEAQAQLDQADAAVALQKALLNKKKITAPFNGTLGIRQVDLGEYLAAGAKIVSLQALDSLYLDFSLPENQLVGVVPGLTLQISVDGYPGKLFSGVISAINPKVEDASRNLKIRATLPNDDRLLKPGMFARVRLLIGAPEPVLTLPATAVTYTTYGDTVYVIETLKNEAGEEQNLVTRRPVTTGQTRDGRVQIIAGLNSGERVVSAGQVKLRDGIAVLIGDRPTPDERGQ